MEINNWFDFILYSIFTLIAIVIALPLSIYALKKGIEGWIKFGCCRKLPKYFIDSGWGKTSLEVLFSSIITILLMIWYLFIDKGGHLFYWLNEVKDFFTQSTTFIINFKTIMSISFSILFLSFITSIFFIKSHVKEKDGFYVLQYNFMFKIFSYFMIIVSILLFQFVLEKEDRINLLIVYFIVLFLPSIMMFLQFNLVKIKYDNKNIYLYSPWRKNKIIEWSNLKTYKILKNRQIHRFTTYRGDIINIPFSVSGLEGFFERLDKEDIARFNLK